MKLSTDETKTLETLATDLLNFITSVADSPYNASFTITQKLHSKIFDSLTNIVTSTNGHIALRHQQQHLYNSPTNPQKDDSL